MPAIVKRLLSPQGRGKRVVLLDNVKSHRFSWAELEAFITSPVISGHEMYRGEGQRPNTTTVAITVNGASLSKDLAQRAIVVRAVPAGARRRLGRDGRRLHRQMPAGDPGRPQTPAGVGGDDDVQPAVAVGGLGGRGPGQRRRPAGVPGGHPPASGEVDDDASEAEIVAEHFRTS